MDNTDQQNPTSTPLDITPSSDQSVTETTVTETTAPVTPQPVSPVLTPPTSIPVNISVNAPVTPTVTPPPTPISQPLINTLVPRETTIISTPTESTTITEAPSPAISAPAVTTTESSVIETPSTSTMPVIQETTTTLMPDESTQIGTPAPVSISAPVITPMGTPTPPSTQEVTTVTTAPEEPLVPKKKGVSPLVMGLATVLFIGVVGGGVFAVSRAISSQQPIAPTAPVSEPAAFEPPLESALPTPTSDGYFNPPSGIAISDESVDCSTRGATMAYVGQCLPVAQGEDGKWYWIPQSGN